MRCMTLPKNSQVDDSSMTTCFWQLFTSDILSLDGPFQGNGDLSHFPILLRLDQSGYRANTHLLHDFDTITDHGTRILVHAALHVPHQQRTQESTPKFSDDERLRRKENAPHQFNHAKYTLLASSSLVTLKLIAVFCWHLSL